MDVRYAWSRVVKVAAAVLVGGGGIGGTSGATRGEADVPLAGGGDLSAGAGGLGEQHVFRLPRLALDDRPAGRAADLLLGHVEEGHRHAVATPQALQVTPRVIRQVEIGRAHV